MRKLFMLAGLLILPPLSTGCDRAAAVENAVLITPSGSRSPELELEIADSAGERQLGLMYRREMPRNHGMLFIFDEEAPRGFWMKNTYIPLDMLFIDSNGRVVSIVEQAVPLTETMRNSTAPAKYVLEIVGGAAKEWGITAGTRIAFLNGPLAARFPDSSP